MGPQLLLTDWPDAGKESESVGALRCQACTSVVGMRSVKLYHDIAALAYSEDLR
jgi:hypothetical protein